MKAVGGFIWKRQAIIAAAHAWHAKHGFQPTATEWRSAAPDHPSEKTVRVRFGSWNALIEAAGWQTLPTGRRCLWTRAEVLDAVYAWRREHGRTPRAEDWNHRTDVRYPSRSTVKHLFGGWNLMLEAGGYTLNQSSPLSVLARREERRRYKREWMRKKRAATKVAVLCAECNTERLVRAEYAQKAAEHSCRACNGTKAGRAWVAERERRCAQKIDRLLPPATAPEQAEVLEMAVRRNLRSSDGRTETASYAATIDLTDQGVAA